MLFCCVVTCQEESQFLFILLGLEAHAHVFRPGDFGWMLLTHFSAGVYVPFSDEFISRKGSCVLTH